MEYNILQEHQTWYTMLFHWEHALQLMIIYLHTGGCRGIPLNYCYYFYFLISLRLTWFPVNIVTKMVEKPTIPRCIFTADSKVNTISSWWQRKHGGRLNPPRLGKEWNYFLPPHLLPVAPLTLLLALVGLLRRTHYCRLLVCMAKASLDRCCRSMIIENEVPLPVYVHVWPLDGSKYPFFTAFTSQFCRKKVCCTLLLLPPLPLLLFRLLLTQTENRCKQIM